MALVKCLSSWMPSCSVFHILNHFSKHLKCPEETKETKLVQTGRARKALCVWHQAERTDVAKEQTSPGPWMLRPLSPVLLAL